MKAKSNTIVSIVIVTRGVNGYLKSCLDSIVEQTYSPVEIIVIDNSLDTNFSQDIIQCFPRVKLYPQKINIVYCEALNCGIKQSTGNFILCLNDDIILDKMFLEEALKGFLADSKIGMVSGKILRRDGKTIDSTGLFLTFYRTAMERGYSLKDRGQFEKPGYIFGVNGAVALYRKEALEDIKDGSGYFDSDFHIFYEDLDVAWRAKHHDWKGYYIPSAIAYHVRGGTVRLTSGIARPFARRYLDDTLHLDLIKNRYLTIIKNESGIDLLFHLPAIFLYDLIMWSYILLFRPKLIKNFLFSIKYLKTALRKRLREVNL